MTRKEAISLLKQVNKILVNSNSWLENTHEPLNIAFDMAIKALEQEPCDSISRQAVLELYQTLDDNDTICIWLLRKNIEQIPPITPKQKTGEWINNQNGTFECSKCGIKHSKSNYCPNCGAQMIKN